MISFQNKTRFYINEIIVVSDEKVSKDASLVKISEADHVLNPLDGGRVHGLDSPLRSQPLFFSVVVNNLNKKNEF